MKRLLIKGKCNVAKIACCFTKLLIYSFDEACWKDGPKFVKTTVIILKDFKSALYKVKLKCEKLILQLISNHKQSVTSWRASDFWPSILTNNVRRPTNRSSISAKLFSSHYYIKPKLLRKGSYYFAFRSVLLIWLSTYLNIFFKQQSIFNSVFMDFIIAKIINQKV